MVLSTLHTNDAPQTLTRLMNMGVPTFNIASSVLDYRPAPGTPPVQPQNRSKSGQALLDAGLPERPRRLWTLYGPRLRTLQKANRLQRDGRHLSGHTGSEAIQRMIMRAAPRSTLPQAQQEGVKNLRESGLLKVKQGVTSLDEVSAPLTS